MPQMDGIQATREIAKSGTNIPTLLFTGNLSPQIMELARNAGLRGAISKAEMSKIPYAIKALQRGETFSLQTSNYCSRPRGKRTYPQAPSRMHA